MLAAMPGAGTAVVACLGSSTTHGKGQAYDWISDLRARPINAGLRFMNFGAGGDLAYNTLLRLPRVIEARPDKAVILVGGDDVLASTFPKMRRFVAISKRLPRGPAPDWYEDCLRQIVRQLKSQTPASIALCSLGPIGEAPQSTDPVQEKLNRLIAEYSAIVGRVAQQEAVAYVPFYERMQEQIVARPGPAFTEFRFWPMYRDAFRTFVLRKDLDALGAESGWYFHTDGIHLNHRGGKILVDLVQDFLGA
jgi:lysophospholipase L1-like esterase